MLTSIRKAFGLVDVDRRWVAAYLVSAVMASILEAGGLAMVFVFFQVALSPEELGGIEILKRIHVWAGEPDTQRFLALLSIAVAALFLLRSGMLFISLWIAAAFRRTLQMNLTHRLFRAYLGQSYVWHVQKGTTRLISNVAQHVGGVVQHLIVAALDIVAALLMMAVLLGSMAVLRPTETAVAIVVLGGVASLFFFVFRTRVTSWGQRYVASVEGVYGTVREALRGIKTVKVHELQEFFAARVDQRVHEMMDIAVRQSLIQQVPRILFEIILVAGVLLAVAIAFGSGVPAAEIVPTMALFGAAAIRILPHVTKVLNHLQGIRMFDPALNAIRGDLFEMGRQPATHPPAAPPMAGFGTLELRDVSFSWNTDKAAVRRCSLALRAGERLALVGLSGSGKTTLMDILTGLVSPDEGQLVIDGQCVERFPYNLFAYVPQESFIISDTLRTNIALDAVSFDQTRMDHAVEQAALGAVVARLPNGLDSALSEDGIGLSGGERQRLGIARAIYRGAKVLVMDEPTSALDAVTEAEVSDAIRRLGRDTSVIVIAHRLSTIQHFDTIAFMADGRIVAEGSFREVYADNVEFRKMVDYLSISSDTHAA